MNGIIGITSIVFHIVLWFLDRSNILRYKIRYNEVFSTRITKKKQLIIITKENKNEGVHNPEVGSSNLPPTSECLIKTQWSLRSLSVNTQKRYAKYL